MCAFEDIDNMKFAKSPSDVGIVFRFLLLISLILPIIFVSPISAAPQVDVTVDSSRTTGVNDFNVAFKLDYEWERWCDSSTLRQMAEDAGFKLVAFYVWKSNSPRACSYWYESTKSGKFDWRDVDSLVERILEIDAEPLLSLGGYDMSSKYLPPGMATNPRTGLPYPGSWAAYCAEWVKHFKAVGLPVKYYEITTEPFKYFGWTADLTKLSYYVELWNAAARKMRAVDSGVLLSQDFITAQRVLDYWLKHGDDVDFLDFHKYDSYALEGTGHYSDEELLRRAETSRFVTTSGGTYGVDEARQKWFNARGKLLPVINSECNLNSAWKDGTDPRIQKMVGAVWTALMLRMSILKGLKYSTYFSFGSNARYTRTGNGFGMINLDNNRPWYPYYVHKWLGNNLDVGDILVETASSSDDVRSLAWINGEKLNVFIICKIDQSRTLSIYGLEGQIKYYKIDNTISYLDPEVQTGTINSGTPLYLKGYTVILLQSDVSTPPPPPPPAGSYVFEDGFESGDFNAWSSTYSSTGEATTVKSEAGYNSVYGASFTTSGNGGYEYAQARKTIAGMSQLYARAYVKVVTNGIADSGDKLYFITFRAGSDNVLSAGWRQSGSVLRWHLLIRDGTGYSGAYSDSAPSPDQWYCIEAYWLKDGANGKGTLWVNEAQVINVLGKDTNNYGDVKQVRFGNSEAYNVASTEVFGDNFVVADEYIGPESPQHFEDDFESGNFNKWTGTTTTSGETVTVANYDPYSGNYHGRFASNGGSGVEHAYCYMTVDQEKVYARGYFQINQGLSLSDNDDRFYFLRFRAGGQSLAGIGIRRHNGVEKWMVYGRDGSSWVWPTYTTSPSIERFRWYCIELCWHKDAAQGRIEMYIDGQKIFEITDIDTSYYGNVDTVQFGLVTATGVQNTLKIYGDSLAISNTYIGP